MKKVLLVAIAVAMMVAVLSGALMVSGQGVVRVTVDGNNVFFPDANPFIDENGRTLIPVRFVVEDLGAKVDWNPQYKEVYITKNDVRVLIRINQTHIFINDQMKTMDTKAIIKDDRTYVPIRYVAEALGASVDWDSGSRTVIIKTITELEPTPIPGAVVTPNPNSNLTPGPQNPEDRVKVEEDGEFSELSISFFWSSDRSRYLADCDYAESVIASKYDSEIAKEVIDMVRNRTERVDTFRKTIRYDGKNVDIISSGGIIIHFWNAGVNPR
ncbi:UNVERIFIED_CONTAM: copper amine oxidase-like protein [Acetivibrio alkalicellulosi]